MSECSKKLLDLEQRSVIKFLTKEGKKPKEIFERMAAIYRESAPSEYKLKFWSKQFKRGRESIEEDPDTGRPVTSTTPEICKKVEEFILTDRRVPVSRIVKGMDIWAGTVWITIHEHLQMSKVSVRWVPRFLTALQKDARRECSQQNLDLISENPASFFKRLLTGDETWVYHGDPESKRESMQWKHRSSPTPKKRRVEKSAGKVMATVFWDEEGLLEFMPHTTGRYKGRDLR